MSASNAAAIRRRANIQTNNPPPVPQKQANSNNSPNAVSQKPTLTQFITSLDERIKNLENKAQISNSEGFDAKLIEEYNTRFDILANEIGELKDVILKLQSFTMEVNKSLYDDRIQIMSDIPNVSMPVENTESKLINQLSVPDQEKTDNDISTSSVDIKTMVEEEISASQEQ